MRAEIEEVLPRAVRFMRSHIDELVEETMREIHTRIPEYARPTDETYRRTVRAGVELAMRRFIDLLDRRDETNWREVYEAIGAGEMHEGRSLDVLQAAMRVGARTGWRKLIVFGEQESLSATTMGALSDAIWVHLDDLAAASVAGYARARIAEAGELDRRRRRLIELLVAEQPAAEEAVTAAAVAARWQLPRRLAVVAVDPSAATGEPPMLPPEVLVGFDRPEPMLIVPDPESPAQRRVIENTLAGIRAAVGLPMPPPRAALSLRSARRTLDLAVRGVLAGDGLLWCGDHLATLILFQDEELLAALVRRRLHPLSTVRESQRALLADTLLALLQENMNASAVAAKLHFHPQTVRRRLHQLDRLFGDQLHDGDARFELEIALRAERAGRAGRSAVPVEPSGPTTCPPAITGVTRLRAVHSA